MSKEYWFRQKRYGMGAGMPIHWKGWLLTVLWIAVTAPLLLLIRERPGIAYTGLVVTVIVFVWISWRKTEGGWRWRWDD